MENIENKPVKSSDDYSFIKTRLKHWKKKLVVFFIGLIKNAKRVTWSDKKLLIEEFVCVLIIVVIFSIYFYFIFLFISSII